MLFNKMLFTNFNSVSSAQKTSLEHLLCTGESTGGSGYQVKQGTFMTKHIYQICFENL